MTHEHAAVTHDRVAKHWDGRGDDEKAERERALARKDRDGAELERERQQLCREGHGSRSREMASQLREDREVGVQPDAIQSSDAQREQRPLMLEPSELALDSSARAVKVARALGVTGDQRVQAIRLDPR